MMTVPPQLTSSLPSFSYPASFRHPPPASSIYIYIYIYYSTVRARTVWADLPKRWCSWIVLLPAQTQRSCRGSSVGRASTHSWCIGPQFIDSLRGLKSLTHSHTHELLQTFWRDEFQVMSRFCWSWILGIKEQKFAGSIIEVPLEPTITSPGFPNGGLAGWSWWFRSSKST